MWDKNMYFKGSCGVCLCVIKIAASKGGGVVACVCVCVIKRRQCGIKSLGKFKGGNVIVVK